MPSFQRSSSASSQPTTYKFPRLSGGDFPRYEEEAVAEAESSPITGSFPKELSNGFLPTANGSHNQERWQPRRISRDSRPNVALLNSVRRGRQKSLSEALKTIKDRRGSVSENAHEIAAALKAPVSPQLVLLCAIWYGTSILSNASSKSILIAFRYPVTLTLVQFAFVSSWCLLSSYLAHLYPSLRTMIPALKHPIRPPTKDLIMTTLPLTAFQIGGHILNSDAMARIPVSLVHTIKGLSPLFTVLAYRLIFRVHYSIPTYLSLIPLTLGVIMACSANTSANLLGLVFAFGSAILFVTQNIVSKRIFNDAARAESDGLSHLYISKKPDKLNLLCYASGLALIFTFPIWVWSEGFTLISDFLHDGAVELANRPDALDHGRLALEFIFNGTFHFAQSLVAFILLSMVSPVTYSVASLIKRVFVISFAIAWFGQPMTRVQASGIALTFVGLYLYDRTSDAARADRRAKAVMGRGELPILPLIKEDRKIDLSPLPRPLGDANHVLFSPPMANGVANGPNVEAKRSDIVMPVGRTSMSGGRWLPPGTKQESTWMLQDQRRTSNVAL